MDHAPYYSELKSPVGSLLLVGDAELLCGLYMDGQRHLPELPPNCRRSDSTFRHVREQLKQYFAGRLRRFEVTTGADGSPFQRSVWRALVQIPYGATESYGDLARRIGNAGASRAVGLANGRNPVGIIVPCHRVIGKDGSLTGYGGGLTRKRWLLEHEAKHG